MMFFTTFVFTFFLVLVAVVYFWLRGTPVYRVEKENIIRLLELVVAEQAEENDWQVFVAYPIRHDRFLAEIQQRCLEIAETEYLGNNRHLFSARGRAEIQLILDELKSENIKDNQL